MCGVHSRHDSSHRLIFLWQKWPFIRLSSREGTHLLQRKFCQLIVYRVSPTPPGTAGWPWKPSMENAEAPHPPPHPRAWQGPRSGPDGMFSVTIGKYSVPFFHFSRHLDVCWLLKWFYPTACKLRIVFYFPTKHLYLSIYSWWLRTWALITFI